MVGLPGDKDAVCAAPKPRVGQDQPDVCLPLEPPVAQAGPCLPASLLGIAGPRQADSLRARADEETATTPFHLEQFLLELLAKEPGCSRAFILEPEQNRLYPGKGHTYSQFQLALAGGLSRP